MDEWMNKTNGYPLPTNHKNPLFPELFGVEKGIKKIRDLT
jgi:hypothetical protein